MEGNGMDKSSKSALQTATKGDRKNSQQSYERIFLDILNSSYKAAVSRTEKIKGDSFLSDYHEIDEYLDNFKKDNKKYLLLQGGTKERQDKIFKYVLNKITELDLLRREDYDYQSWKIVDCSSANDEEILDMIYGDHEEDQTSIMKMFAIFLKGMQEIKKDDSLNYFDTDQIIKKMNRRFEFLTTDTFKMAYDVKNQGNGRMGGFTLKGLATIADIINATLKSELPISEISLLSKLGIWYSANKFTKLKIVLLTNISRENKFGLGPKENRPDLLFAALKKGESVEGLSRTFKNKNLFELVELDGDEAVVNPLIKGTTQKSKAISGITKQRGLKPRHSKYDACIDIIKGILKDDKNGSLGSYVMKVKAEMERKGLKDKNKDNGLIYKDTTIRSYIQRHSEYKNIQKRKG